MVDRGGCTFVIKVRNAQHAGALAVLIADDTCLCSAGDACVSDDKKAACEVNEPVMANDGLGGDVTIPSFLVFKQDADPVKKLLKKDKMVRAEMSWKLPAPDARVEYELWSTPKEAVSAPLKQSFREVAVALGEHAQFTPHFYVYDGIFAGCRDTEGENQCYNLCTNEGRYCATDPDDDLDKGISGAMVVTESLRQICIWRLYGGDGVGLPWWDYIEEFEFRCDKEEDDGKFFGSEPCVKDAMQRSGIDYDKVSSCMKGAGGLEEDVENSILEQELAAREKQGVLILPSFFVNQSPLRGAMTTSEVFEAICAGYIAGSEPPICKQCNKCSDVNKCVEVGFCPGGGSPNAVSLPVFASSLLGVVMCFSILALIQWQRSQRQMRAQVRGIMAEYMPLDKNQTVSTVGFNEDDADEHEQTFELS
jgi:PA domain